MKKQVRGTGQVVGSGEKSWRNNRTTCKFNLLTRYCPCSHHVVAPFEQCLLITSFIATIHHFWTPLLSQPSDGITMSSILLSSILRTEDSPDFCRKEDDEPHFAFYLIMSAFHYILEIGVLFCDHCSAPEVLALCDLCLWWCFPYHVCPSPLALHGFGVSPCACSLAPLPHAHNQFQHHSSPRCSGLWMSHNLLAPAKFFQPITLELFQPLIHLHLLV